MDAIDFLSDFDGIQAGDVSSLLDQFEEVSQIWNQDISKSALKQPDEVPPTSLNTSLDVQIDGAVEDEAIFVEQIFIGDQEPPSLPNKITLNTADCNALDTVNEIIIKAEPVSNLFDGVILSTDMGTEYDQCDLDVFNCDCVGDHNYCQNTTQIPQVVLGEHDARAKGDEADLEDGEIMCDGEDDVEIIDNIISAESECNYNVNLEKIRKPNCKNKRNYRRKSRRPASSDLMTDQSVVYFDKIPTYYTALSIPNKNMIKKGNDTSTVTTGLPLTDFIPRDSSPVRKTESDVLNKLPAYYSCFTNSTRYDETGAAIDCDTECEIEQQPQQEQTVDNCNDSNSDDDSKYPWDRMRDKTFSAQSSRSQSPVVLLDDVVNGPVRLPSRSRSRSSSQSSCPSCSSCASDCSSYRSVSPIRTRDKEIRGQRQRDKRKSSYSSHSRSRSRSRSWSHSRSRSRSRSPHSRSRSRSWTRSRSRRHHARSKSSLSRSHERRRQEYFKKRQIVKEKQMKDRRIVYVGRIPDGYTRTQLYRRFERFGDIDEVSVHFREQDDNYGFVTFAYTCDAYAAIEKGNNVPNARDHFDLCFGGRRQFCETQYADLDGLKEEDEEYDMVPKRSSSAPLDFDELLKQAKTKIKKSSS